MKNKSNANIAGMVTGSMNAVSGNAKVKNVRRTRRFLEKVGRVTTSAQVLSQSQSLYPVGSQYSAGTELFSADLLSTNAIEWIQKHDKYTIEKVELFATLASKINDSNLETVPIELYYYEDVDADPVTTTSWIRVQDRDNVGKVVLNAFHPSRCLMTFTPTASFAATGTVAQDPSNMIPKKGMFVDALSINQKFSGVRWFAACPQVDSQGQSYSFSINLTARVTVTAMQPL